MQLKDNEMNRSITQALYKYLPEMWIDFYIKETRTMYTAKVRNWNTDILSEINSNRLLEKIRMSIDIFNSKGGKLDGFSTAESIILDNFEIRTYKLGETPDIFSEISPLIFYCSKCNKIERKSKSAYIRKDKPNLSRCCNKELNQISFIYRCECGWAGPVEIIPCNKHGYDHMIYTNGYSFVCGICKEEKQMNKVCPECGTMIYPTMALDNSNFIPFSISTVDLINMGEEKFLFDNKDDASVIIISKWINKLTEEEYKYFIKNGIHECLSPEQIDRIKELEATLRKLGCLTENQIKQAKQEKIDEYTNSVNITKLRDYIDINMGNIAERNNTYYCASNILEYFRILNADKHDGYICTLDQAIKIASELKTNIGNEDYREIMSNLGIKNIQASGNIPFVFCTYGYTRKENTPKMAGKLKMKFFKGEQSELKNSIYGVKLMTEGILIEIDKKRIIEWLLKNNFINENELPIDTNDENKLKEWFLNNINLEAIQSFEDIDENSFKITSHVYKLLHSISHSLIKQAGYLSGLDKDSLSEYIFPQIPAIFIYCQNSQGLSLGSLFNLYETQLSKWLKFTLDSVQTCIFDPICIEREKACAGCIYINEVSCTHFNKDLDRSYLIGNMDIKEDKRTFGFWEKL